MKVIVNTQTGFELTIDNKTKAQVVRELKEAGQDIGKTAVAELIDGKKEIAKFFKIEERQEVMQEKKRRGRKQKNSTVSMIDASKVHTVKKASRKLAELIMNGVNTINDLTNAMQADEGEKWTRQVVQTRVGYLERCGVAKIDDKMTYKTRKEVKNHI